MGNRQPPPKKVEPIKFESEFRLNKEKQVYKEYPILPNLNQNEKDEEDSIKQDNWRTKDKISIISKINIQKYCRIDEGVEQMKQNNLKTNSAKLERDVNVKKLNIVNEKQNLKIIRDINKDLNDLDGITKVISKISFLRDITKDNSFW